MVEHDSQGGEQIKGASLELQPEVPNLAPADLDILRRFGPDDQAIILGRLADLIQIAQEVGGDSDVQIHFSEPGSREWKYEVGYNVIYADPDEILTGDIETTKFSMAHEGGHRRITLDEGLGPYLGNPGFLGVWICLEDPRNNNRINDYHPEFTGSIDHIYRRDLGFVPRAQEELGHIPRLQLIAEEYMKLWLQDRQGQPMRIESEHLEPELKDAITATLALAQEFWWRYPDHLEVRDDDQVKAYSAYVNGLLIDKIWPLLQPLAKKDTRDQTVSDALSGIANSSLDPKSARPPAPPQVHIPSLSDQEQAAVQEAVNNAFHKATQVGTGQQVDITALPEELRDKIGKLIASSPGAGEARHHAEEKLRIFEKKVADEREAAAAGVFHGSGHDHDYDHPPDLPPGPPSPQHLPSTEHDRLPRDPNEAPNAWGVRTFEAAIERHSELIDATVDRLRKVFTAREFSVLEHGYHSGRQLDLGRRVGEKARSIRPDQSGAWARRHEGDLPRPEDYAFEFLIDLSYSMLDDPKTMRPAEDPTVTRLFHSYEALAVLSKIMSEVRTPFGISGFHSTFMEFKDPDETIEDALPRISNIWVRHGGVTDMSWGVDQASERLAAQAASERYLVVICDGLPSESSVHDGKQYDFKTVVQGVEEAGQTVIGLGIQVRKLSEYFRNALSEDNVELIVQRLVDLLVDLIEHPDHYQQN